MKRVTYIWLRAILDIGYGVALGVALALSVFIYAMEMFKP